MSFPRRRMGLESAGILPAVRRLFSRAITAIPSRPARRRERVFRRRDYIPAINRHANVHKKKFKSTFLYFYLILVDTCPPLVAPENGRISGDNVDCDSIVQFSCDPCYGLTGSSLLECEPGGVWSNVPPTCERTILISSKNCFF